jgi:hypothetical protein
VNPRSIFFGRELAKFSIPGKTEPVLLVVVSVEVRRAKVDFAAFLDAIRLGLAKIGAILRVRIAGTPGLHGSGGGKKNCDCDAKDYHQYGEWTLHEGPPGGNVDLTINRWPKANIKALPSPRAHFAPPGHNLSPNLTPILL